MSKKYSPTRLVFIGAAVVLVASLALAVRPPATIGSTAIELEAPPIAEISEEEASAISSVVGEEAGISAYFQAPTTIDLADVRGTYRTIENDPLIDDADYILGSVGVPDYPESEDVHVFVHTDGWFMAYYLENDPAAKIFDWRSYHDSERTTLTTKLESVLVVVAAEAGLSFPGATYYDFRYPNANRMTLVAEWSSSRDTDSFEMDLPGTFSYYERSWSLGSTDDGSYALDDTELHAWHYTYGGWRTTEGTLSASQLLPDQSHTVEVWGVNYAYGGIALVYRMP